MAIRIKPSHRGRLHDRLGVPDHARISKAALDRALASDDPSLRKQAQFAVNARKWKHR